MTPTLTAPDPTIFSEDVLAFAAGRGVTDYLVPLYELARRAFPGLAINVQHEYDPEIAGLEWICYIVATADMDIASYRAAKDRWHSEYGKLPPAVRASFVLGLG